MPRFLIERAIPGAGRLDDAQVQEIVARSCAVLREMGPEIQWVQSFVTADRFYCVYVAPDEAAVRRHAELGGFPADRILRIHRVVDPTAAG